MLYNIYTQSFTVLTIKYHLIRRGIINYNYDCIASDRNDQMVYRLLAVNNASKSWQRSGGGSFDMVG